MRVMIFMPSRSSGLFAGELNSNGFGLSRGVGRSGFASCVNDTARGLGDRWPAD